MDEWYQARITDLSQIEIPVLSCGNWGGNALHLLGNVEGYMRIPSKQKWLELHGLEHFAEFYTPYGVDLQKRFFNHFLKGMDMWHQAPVHLRLRNVDGTFTDRDEQEWPIARTDWTKYYLDVNHLHLSTEQPEDGETSFYGFSNGLSFFTPPLEQELEITGNIAAKLFVKSTTEDADLFVTLRVLDPDGRDVTFISAGDPKGVIATGWLRASHRKLDTKKSLPYRPWHTHDEKQPLLPGEVYELDIEVWPTSVVIPAGYRLGVQISGKDFEIPNYGAALHAFGTTYFGNGSYTHDNPADRDPSKFGGHTTLVSENGNRPYLLLPIIPPKKERLKVAQTEKRFSCADCAAASCARRDGKNPLFCPTLELSANVVIGLCAGHDSIFFKHSEAYCTTLITKDRRLGHNPAAALYTTYSYYKRLLQEM